MVNRLKIWLQEAGCLVWLPLFWFFHVSAWIVQPPGYTTFFNWGSVGFEIVGGGIVLWQLNEMSTKFKNKGIPQSVRSWINKCPLWYQPKSASVNTSWQVQAGVSMDAILVPGKQRSLEEKVEYLMSQVGNLDTRLSDIKTQFTEDVRQLKSEHSALRSDLRNTQSELQDALVGDVRLEVFGALIIAQGVIMGAMV